MEHKRESQPERWWTDKECPIKGSHLEPGGYVALRCTGANCAFWRETRSIDGEKNGVCTY
ncbi:MAG: hypothetical protein RBS34_11680 [Desulfofustis sp.]|jgi:hypothetical protein|nr:hypothetical protein [Desulfofustis sp.]